MTLVSASTLSRSVVRTLRGGEVLPKMFCLVASSLGHLRNQCPIVCGSSLQIEYRGEWRKLSAAKCGRLEGAQLMFKRKSGGDGRKELLFRKHVLS